VIYRKPPIVRKTIMVYLAYVAATVALAMCSIESLRVQLFMMRTYWGFAIFIIPIITFSHERFNISVFFSRTLVFVMLISIFYILDAVIFCGNFLIPYANPWGETSTFYRPDIHPLSFHVFRKYPYGMYLLVLLVVPLARNMRIKLWQAATIAAALLCTQTFTIISGFILAFAIFQGKTKRLLAMLTLLPVLFMALYFVDSLLPVRKSEHFQSTLRIKSSVDQFADLFQAVDDEDLAQFASGRMAQILPKVDIIVRNHKEMTGLGFLHPDKTKITQYIITNEYYSDVSENEEVAAVVEVVPVQIFISMGYIGLAVHILFLVFLYLIIRKLKYSVYFLSMIFCSFWFGLGGFCGLHSAHGLFLAALTYSVVILANRESLPGFRLPPVKARIQNAIP
ncbi:MAG: hypothetical protein K2F79_02330, partial [Muribaculaceae bacterium]|nr:hypothetical protein [Muribaculaceae bacterium]